MFRFLPGLILLQAATAVLVYAALSQPVKGYWIAFGLIALLTNVLTAFWFGAIVKQIKKDAVARTKEVFAKERERLRLQTEKEKSKVIEQSHKRVVQETNRAQAKANFKVGAAFVGALGVGAVMLFTELVTLGLLTLSTGGGALAGYLMRERQAQRGHRTSYESLGKPSSGKVIEAKVGEALPYFERRSN
ncbi:MAG: hypothetical protein ACREYF_28640 [Gammaproteobacteria bacterium]